jgi:radical SAM protein with 4Fe4S-binding SPASM domain
MANKSFHIDVNSTKSCNLRCTYCFEVKDEMDKSFVFQETDALIIFVDQLIASDWFNENYSDLSINFWGGEPSLNQDLYDQLIIQYINNPKVRFFMYSNGVHFNDHYIQSFKDLQRIYVNGHPKIVVQVSYDGNPIHDLTRVTPNGRGSAEMVRSTIRQLQRERIFHVLKSTIDPTNFNYLFEAYKDVLNFNNDYFPTIEMHAECPDYKEYGQDLYDNLIKIAAHERKTGEFFFRWFKSSKALCAAGKDMIAIDINGNILPCHGALYTDYDEHLITNIKEVGSVECTIASTKKFEKFWNNQPQKCKNCKNAFCLRCNIAKFQYSKRETYPDKWTDHTVQEHYCYFMDIVDVVSKATKHV